MQHWTDGAAFPIAASERMHEPLKERNILLGVSGGIAAYKSVELLRLMTTGGAGVRVVMTANAGWFVGPGTFQALSGAPVCSSVFDEHDAAIKHIEWAQTTDLAVVAPATANVIGKLANGIADDALTTFMLAVTAPVVICPAMNTNMYRHPAVQRNLARLRAFGHHIIEPDDGSLACGTVGPGRLPAPAVILESLCALMSPQDLAGRTILITAGPTREALDPVRFVSNPSSGKMGFALARAACWRGARVHLVTGPVALAPPLGVALHPVVSAAEMSECVMRLLPQADIVIKAAAVADYRPVNCAAHKVKKSDAPLQIAMERTVDILQTIGTQKEGRILVGFAAETQDLQSNARQKLKTKQLDLIVGNLINAPGAGFGSDTNQVSLFYPDGEVEALPVMSKDAVAHVLLDRIAALRPASG
jgi:phosphopantothenoylcysteine decarboxylase/phosphopantothenate--cysteine ligase